MKLTRKQFLEKYGDVKVMFSFHYKYVFSFEGEFKRKRITVYVGGSADDIYGFRVRQNKEYRVRDLDYDIPVTQWEIAEGVQNHIINEK